ncbi:hypothetical protein M3A49_01190 [Paraburkholderia sp. CNPSo 3076]|uniref:hypothetical protein n=1 Tax=Paraburkholderia sp. CNPSo 3076 TaxID=2940936 RepID=UPI0022510EDD|nr:hypothetical protein [Paraburkholderia sp. CNPSo 3076]MCX5538123.1 hypothetical protein [Paraburkholderia sp. CNPSo 3076]
MDEYMAGNPIDSDAKLDKKFAGLWCRARKLPSLSDLNAETISLWAKDAGVVVQEVAERKVGAFRPIPAVVLTVAGKTAYFPTVSASDDPSWLANMKAREREAALWSKVEWFAPLWVARGQTGPLLADIEHRSKEEAIARFDYHTSTIYTLPFQAICVAQFISKSRTLSTFYPIAREAYLAFFAGHRASSIAALIPVMEGALQRISEENGNLSVTDQIDRVIDRACALAARIHFDHNWVPGEYSTKEYLYGLDERVFAFQTFRRWLKEVFYRQTDKYDGVTWLNRHVFAHGTSTDWANGGNFRRLVVALATFGVIESWHDETNAVPLMLPEMNNDSRLLWQQALLQAQGQTLLKMVEQKNYQKYGQLVPPMPTDNGVGLRKAHLKQECIKDLVRPLRNSGWAVEVGEPDEQALQMKVIARSGDAEMHFGLLFSCATDNEIYRELAQSCAAILYLESPENQAAFAYGIDVHVGPVAAWQPPQAPTPTRVSFLARCKSWMQTRAAFLKSARLRSRRSS